MAHDRLAQLRSQRSAGGMSPTSAEQYEMNVPMLHNPGGNLQTMGLFNAEVDSILAGIATFSSTVSQISTLHQRSLATVVSSDDTSTETITALTQSARSQSNDLARRVELLFGSISRGFGGTDAEKSMRRNRAGLVKKKLMDTVSEFQQVEKQNRTRTRDRVERQIRIVKPDATSEEISAVVNSDDNAAAQIFSMANPITGRYSDSLANYHEIQGRQAELKRLEQTMAELAQMFIDLGRLVEDQDEAFDVINDNASDVEKNVEKGDEQLTTAVRIARAVRKKKQWCFILAVIIIIILVFVILYATHVIGPK
ncbi:t-SNARE [Stereum hirsutum FP-91666 SS1]|uniref:t-SNARE n=1 Tax=Stereum hirsutum (strain FP-91666) TaxID=721885 RepID=UPI0004409F6C|nr:t-SNARE [Stereum hirsutum FP-91666 SS1]EIM88579.1 t-SNARE [Stereum hirsutum FP-91666 SS1]